MNTIGFDFGLLRKRVRHAVICASPTWLAGHLDDIVQAAMLRLMRAVARQGAGATFNATYLAKVARCAVTSEIRRLRPGREVPLPDDAETLADARAIDPARATVHAEVRQQIVTALGRLSTDRRRAVALYLHGHGVTEAAQMLGWNPKRTENLLLRGLRDLRGDLARAGVSSST